MSQLQDFTFDLGFLIDSLETSVSWSKCWGLIQAVKQAWSQELAGRKLFNTLAIRISQIYSHGACVYMHYGIGPTTDKDQLEAFEDLMHMLRRTVIASGGSCSHHHGIGKKNLKYYADSVSQVGLEMFKSVKAKLDPNNVFDAGNLIEEKLDAKLWIVDFYLFSKIIFLVFLLLKFWFF